MDSDQKRKDGLCPMTPEETALVLRALDIDPSYQIYIAAGEIYGGEKRMAALASAYPKLVSHLKKTQDSPNFMTLLPLSSSWVFSDQSQRCWAGEEGDLAGALGSAVFSEPFIPDGCVGLSGLPRE